MKSLVILSTLILALSHAANYACTGTEPFWSLNISEAEKKAYYFSPEYPEGISFSYAGPYSAQGFDPSFVQVFKGTGSSRRMATLTSNPACSDGMSDTVYAYEAVVFDGKTKVLYGCCNTAEK